MWLKWISWLLSIIGLALSTWAAVRLYHASPTTQDAYDIAVTTSSDPMPTLLADGKLAHYERLANRQSDMEHKARSGMTLLILGFIVQGLAVLLQIP